MKATRYMDAPNRMVDVAGTPFAYRELGNWGVQQPSDLSTIRQPVFVANGDHDRMVPTSNTVDLARRLPNSELKIYPDSGHGGIFQHHDEFVAQALDFLAR